MLTTALLIEAGQADRVSWTGGRNPLSNTTAATQPEPSQQRQQGEGNDGDSPATKTRRTATQQQPDPEPSHTAAEPRPPTEGSTTAASSSQRQETSAYMVLRAQQPLTQLMPTLVGDQVPIAAEALNQLQLWTRGLWGHPVQLVRDSGTDSGDSTAATVPWIPTGSRRGTNRGKEGREAQDGCSLDTEDMPGTETEDNKQLGHKPNWSSSQ